MRMFNLFIFIVFVSCSHKEINRNISSSLVKNCLSTSMVFHRNLQTGDALKTYDNLISLTKDNLFEHYPNEKKTMLTMLKDLEKEKKTIKQNLDGVQRNRSATDKMLYADLEIKLNNPPNLKQINNIIEKLNSNLELSNSEIKAIIKFLDEQATHRNLNFFLNYSELPETIQKLYFRQFNEINLGLKETKKLIEKLNKLKEKKLLPVEISKIERLFSFLHFTQSFGQEKRIKSFELLENIINQTSHNDPIMTQFNEYQKKMDNYEQSILTKTKKHLKNGYTQPYSKYQHQLNKENVTLTNVDNSSKIIAHQKRLEKEAIISGCRSQNSSGAQKIAARRFQYFILGMGPVTTLATYSYYNWDKEKNFQWFSNLGFDLSMGVLFNYFFSKIISNPSSEYLNKVKQSAGLMTSFAVFSGTLYSLIFERSKSKELEDNLDDLLSDPEKKQEIQKLYKHWDNQGLFNHLIQKVNAFIPLIEKNDYQQEFEELQFNLEQMGENIDEDVLRKEFTPILLYLISLDMYHQKNTGHIITGEPGADRAAYYTIVDSIWSFESVVVTSWIFNLTCTGIENPVRSFLLAMLIQTANSILYKTINYPLRREVIGQ